MSRNDNVGVWDPSARKAPPPHQTYEPVAKARTIPVSRVPQRGGSGPTNVQLPGCGPKDREITIIEPNPQRKLLQAQGMVVVCARIEFASWPGWPGHGLVECLPNNQVATRKRAGGTQKKLQECDKQPSYMPCSKGRSVSVSALFEGAQLFHWLTNPCGGILP